MTDIAALIADLVEAGVSPALIGRVAAALAPSEGPQRSAAAIRQARYRDRQASQTITRDVTRDGVTSDVTGITNHNGVTPLAHVRDKPLTTEISGLAAVVVCASTRDDWPRGDAKDWASVLIELCASPRLDNQKSLALNTTLGRLLAWRVAGASWDHDVIPIVVTTVQKRGPPILSWKYFDPAIAQSIADNRQALTIPEASNVRPNPVQTQRHDRLNRMQAGALAAADG